MTPTQLMCKKNDDEPSTKHNFTTNSHLQITDIAAVIIIVLINVIILLLLIEICHITSGVANLNFFQKPV